MTDKMEKYLKLIQYIVFGIFFIFLYMQFQLVGVQYDDYGYYSLNYGTGTPHYGTEYTFAELFRFLGEHYVGANGRLLYFGVWLALFKIGGLPAVQLAAAVTVTIIWYLLCKIGMYGLNCSDGYRVFGSIILCLCYGSMGIRLHQSGTYWFAAFFVYYMPIIAMELFVICYDKYYRELNWKHILVLMPLVFASAWSGETWSVGTVALMFVLLVIDWWKKRKPDAKHILLFGISLAGMLILLMSPGIHHRAGGDEWGLTGISFYIERIKAVFSLFFSEFNMYYFLYFLTGCLILAVVLYLRYHKIVDLLCAIGIAIWEVLVYIDCTVVHACIILVLISIMVPVCRYYYFKKDNRRNMLFFTAFMAIASLAAVPTVGERLYIPFEVCSFLIVFDACYELYNGVVKNQLHIKQKLYKTAGIVALCLYVAGMAGLSAKNSVQIYQGYKANAVVNEYNDAAYRHASELLKQGESVSAVYLKRYPNDIYATTTFYQDPWFKEYIDRYYEISGEIEYIYE